MKGYKLLRVRKDGTLGSLFINARARLPLNEWMEAMPWPTKGYQFRPQWHVLTEPHAPHLSTKGREWYEVEVENFTVMKRPESQGGVWLLAQRMRIIDKVD